MAGTVQLERKGALALVTLSHPGRLNAMSRAMWSELQALFAGHLNADDALRCVLLRGADGAFCAGGDIAEYPSFRFDAASLRHFHEVEVWGALSALLACPVPVVAQIEGPCMGAGLELASCCDIRVAGGCARFGAPIARLGFPMAPREAALVQRAVGDTLARDMLLAAGVHDAPRLLSAGFLLLALPDADVPAAALAQAQRIAALAPQAARLNKRMLYELNWPPAPVDHAGAAIKTIANNTDPYAYAASVEHREGIAAFLEKRAPRFEAEPSPPS